jgi:hypothetical protein
MNARVCAIVVWCDASTQHMFPVQDGGALRGRGDSDVDPETSALGRLLLWCSVIFWLCNVKSLPASSSSQQQPC